MLPASPDSVAKFIVDLDIDSRPQAAAFNAAFPAGQVVPVAIERNGFTVLCRAGTSDIDSLVDTFSGRYHLPARPIPIDATILDLGSNIGTTLMHYGAVFPRARLFGVEMDAENAEMARRNTALLGSRCRILHSAVAGADGEVRYHGAREFGYFISPDGPKHAPALSVPSVLLTFGLQRVDFLKVDIEGAELALFSENIEWLSSVAALYVEIHASTQHVEGFLKLLVSQGFDAWKDTLHWSAIHAVRK